MNAMPKKSRFPSPPLAPVEMHTSTIALMTRESPRENAARKGPPGANQSRAVSLSPGSYDKATRTFQVVLSTGATVKRFGFNEELAIDPAAVDLSRVGLLQCKFLDSHNQGSAGAVLGTVTSARFEAGRLVGTVELSTSEAARALEPDIASGHLRGVSIGYRVDQWTNVSSGDIETWRADKWTLMEASLVAVPADAGALVRSAPNAENDDAERNAPSAMTARQAMNLLDRADFFGERALAERMVRQGHDEATVMQAVQESRRRAVDVAAFIGGPRANIHNERARVMSTGHNEISLDNPATRADAIVAAAVAAASGTEPKGSAREFSGLRSWDDFNRAYGGLIDRTAALGGVRAAHTTSDFPIVGAVGRVLVQRGYEASLSPWMALANQIDVPDFKGDTIARLSGTGKFLPVAETGEIKGTTRFEEGEAIRVGTFAQQIGLSRQLMINAGMRVAGDMFTALGKGGANALGEALSGLFLANSGNGATLSDGNATFTTTRGNKAASGAAIDVTTLGAARKSLRERKEADGITPIKLTPANIVCGPAGETPAEQALSTIWAGQVSDANPFTAKLKILIDQRIAGNAWYLFADPAEATMITVAYLNGQRTPIIEERQGWDVLATEYRGIFDFGVAITDWRPGYLNPGA